MRNKIILIVSILCFSALNMFAQNQDSTRVGSTPKKGMDRITLSSISISAGYYKPSMNYWNNSFLPVANTSERFGGSSILGCNVSFDFPLNLGIRIGAWYWGDKVNGVTASSFNSLKVNFTSILAGVYYTYDKGFYGLKPYFGIDGNYLMIQDKYDTNESVVNKSGNDVVFTPFIGINKVISDKILIGIEYGYFMGSYIQDVQITSGTSGADVDIKGSKIQFTIGYKFR